MKATDYFKAANVADKAFEAYKAETSVTISSECGQCICECEPTIYRSTLCFQSLGGNINISRTRLNRPCSTFINPRLGEDAWCNDPEFLLI